MPEALKDKPLEFFYEEEKKYLLYLDVYWSDVESRVAMVQLTEDDLNEIVEGSVLPKGLLLSTKRMIKSMTDKEEIAQIKSTLIESSYNLKIQEIGDILKGMNKVFSPDEIQEKLESYGRRLKKRFDKMVEV